VGIYRWRVKLLVNGQGGLGGNSMEDDIRRYQEVVVGVGEDMREAAGQREGAA
jgi:hypothetical protein